MAHEQQHGQQSAPLVYVVDNDPSVRQAHCQLIESIRLRAIEFDSADLFLENYDAHHPACLVSNIRLRHGSGIETLRRIRRTRMPVPVIFVTERADVGQAVEAMQLGAVGFLLQPLNSQRFLELVGSATRIAAELTRTQSEFDRGEQLFARLSERERQVMAKLLEGESADSIAKTLHISRKTIDFHRRNLFEKLGTANTAALSRLYWQHAYARVWLDATLANPARQLPNQLGLPAEDHSNKPAET